MRDHLSPERSAEEARHRAPEFNTHSFIIKVWLEETYQSGKAVWRGHITHVPGGERRYLQNLDEIALFIAPYLVAMGVRPTIWQLIRRWLSR